MLYALVIEQELRHGSTNKPYWQVVLKTAEGVVKGMMWDCENPVNNPDYPQLGDTL